MNDSVTETVLIFLAYLENTANTFTVPWANLLISKLILNNPWEMSSFVSDPSRLVACAELTTETAGVAYADHGAYVADRCESLGVDKIDAYFPLPLAYTHTSAEGALVVAQTFLKAVMNGMWLSSIHSTPPTSLEAACD